MYYLHRISHEWEVSKRLFDLGYLSIGWNMLKQYDCSDWDRFSQSFASTYGASRGKQGLWRFLNFQTGDTVVVPLYDKQFAIVTIDGKTISVNSLPNDIKTESRLTYDTDIGFAVHFKECILIPRAFASAALQSRMKIRQTNAFIDDLEEDIKIAKNADSPLNLQAVIRDNVTIPMLDSIHKLTDYQLEHLVKWYMLRIGANRASVLSKNSSEKVGYEDADVRAEFDALGVVILIQVKQHTGTEHSGAIKQVSDFINLRIDMDPEDDNTYIPWVISTADGFDDDATKLAREKGVRLVDGGVFAQMLLDAGIKDIATFSAG